QADNDAWILSISSVDIQNIKHELNIAHASNKLALASLVPDSKSPAAVKTDNVPITADIIKYLVSFMNSKERVYQALHDARKKGYITRSAAKRAINLVRKSTSSTNRPSNYGEWLRIVRNDAVTWSPVVESVNTGAIETGYDLTVPGYETFMAADGVVLSNTVITHVPISSKAVEEVKQMIPSLNILSPKNDSHNISYDQEYMAGLAAGSMLGQRTNKSYKTVAQATEAY